MGSKWRKAKLALGLNLCLYVPKTLEDPSSLSRRSDDTVSLSPVMVPRPTTPIPSSSGLRLPRSISKSSSKKTCAICLTAMKAGQGHAIFTAECSHSFHFHCITTSVKHGNPICPVCRAKWNEVPLQSHNAKSKSSVKPRDDAWMTIPPRRSSQNQSSSRPDGLRPVSSIFNTEPAVFNDDDPLEHQDRPAESSKAGVSGKLEVKTYPEVSEVARSVSFKDFAVLINLKAPAASNSSSSSSRAPVDLVTVLDVSGSMAGTKLALLKRAMGFVIQNLGPFDRLSVISFSSTARRNFPLRLMTETGKQEALQAVNALVSNGGTNIAEGLKKGAKVLIDRRFKNSVSSIVLLSDGQDTYTMTSPTSGGSRGTDYKTLLPKEINGNRIPVHAFGFGADHDASLMHSIAENSGGTFSFIESETVIQDAFAQCIGGLLSVVVQELCVKVECVHPVLRIGSVKAGSYRFDSGPDSRTGCIGVGDLYAEEERNFLVNLDIPIVDGVSDPMSVLKVRCIYKDPMTKETVDLSTSGEVKILRPIAIGERRPVVSIEVDRQRIRLRAAEVISEARVLAERGDLTEAVSVLETCRGILTASVSGRAGDPLCVSLCAELKETQERMASRQVYEASGRAYVLAGLSSHSWQRATARGDMSDTTTMSYQTQSMVDMVNLSQTMNFGKPLASANSSSNSTPIPSAQRRLRQALTFPARPRPR
ncbi:uncharacterized protein LOC112086693 [Eutrema salsugineum]|uniref:uncharacterized protein LOC112086693 n=1 Tax=Eutrema salsugineum TaxID=72664 RepID=UPI000CED3148|nr:uncharacterized protein LOC112086693 [Eutrema salsugineum]